MSGLCCLTGCYFQQHHSHNVISTSVLLQWHVMCEGNECNLLFSLFYRRDIRTTILSFSTQSPGFSTYVSLVQRLPNAICKKTFLVACEATYALLPWPSHCLQISIPKKHLWAVQKYGNQMGQDVDCMLGREKLEFVFESLQVATAIWSRALSWCKTTSFVSVYLCFLQIVGSNFLPA